jgi:HAMP domain-containing protein
MNDDLVKRLRAGVNLYYGTGPCGLLNEAADRIEALEAEVKRLEQQLKMARRLAHRSQPEYPPEIGIPHLRED